MFQDIVCPNENVLLRSPITHFGNINLKQLKLSCLDEEKCGSRSHTTHVPRHAYRSHDKVNAQILQECRLL